MDFGDLFQVIILAAIFLLSALFGAKKKKKPTATGTRPRQQAPRERPRAGPRAATPREPRQPMQSYAEPLDSRTLTEQIVEQFRTAVEQAERRERVLRAEPESVETVQAREVRPESLETLEPAGTASHERFHKRYVDVPATRPAESSARRRTPRLGPRNLREAVVWREVLGPPKGLE